eukprot:2719695-Prymnesium_polylepis.1
MAGAPPATCETHGTRERTAATVSRNRVQSATYGDVIHLCGRKTWSAGPERHRRIRGRHLRERPRSARDERKSARECPAAARAYRAARNRQGGTYGDATHLR